VARARDGSEKFGEGSEALQYDAEKNLLFLIAKEEEREKTADPKQFVFDKVLWKDSQQHDAWEAAGIPIVNSVLEGYTGCVMCYGQTGAGKSFTLANETKGQEGVMVRAFHHIFEKQAESRDLKYDVQISYQQIYLDTITDLLNPGSSIEIREDPKSGVYVDGARWEPVTTAAEAVKVLQKGNSARATAATKMNSASSRSHAALIVRVTTTGGVRTLNGMLYLVDLAGSERVKKSGVEGAAFDEAKAINQSLTTLGRCIEVCDYDKEGDAALPSHHPVSLPLTTPWPRGRCSPPTRRRSRPSESRSSRVCSRMPSAAAPRRPSSCASPPR
jgi:hypothetical protein